MAGLSAVPWSFNSHLKVSAPRPPKSRSLPSPPMRVSLSAPPIKMSSPAPPSILLPPPSARAVSIKDSQFSRT
ncbi:hypothetical protein DDR56_05120 [Halomonas venusta]|uniref:Uncharacterized protein n=1 Tax=Vreelandella venusta TaxID=44935 RepID=A0ABX2BA94_9GAMM|nr:hypothetical protein [Halomonas venusta]